MAFENLIVTTKRSINDIKIDGFLKETTTHKARPTRNPVENGVEITDHVVLEPMEYVMEGVVTNSPIGIEAFTSTGNVGSAFDPGGIMGRSTPDGETRSQQIYLALVELLRTRELIRVETSIKVYDNLVMTSIMADQEKSNANSVFFTAHFQEIFQVVIARSSTSPDNIANPQNAASLGDLQNEGFQTGSPASASEIDLTINSMQLGI